LQSNSQVCTGCTTVISSNTSANITVGPSDFVCIAPGVSATGNITLNGGKLCNEGTVSNLTLIQGYFYNHGEFSKPTGNLNITNAKNLWIECYGTSNFNLTNAMNIDALTNADSVMINVYKGAKFSIGKSLSMSKGYLKIRNALDKSGEFLPLQCYFNIGGQLNVSNAYLRILNNDYGIFNVTNAVNLEGKYNKTILNYGLFSCNNSFNISGNGQNQYNVQIENNGTFNITRHLNSAYNNGTVTINNNEYPVKPEPSFSIGRSLTISKANNTFNNKIVLTVEQDVFLENGSLTNTRNIYVNRDIEVKNGFLDNNGTVVTQQDLLLTSNAAIVNNSYEMRIGRNFDNKGTLNTAQKSLTMFHNFNNQNNAIINGPSNIDGNKLNYSYVYVRNTSENNGPINGYLSFIDLSYIGGNAIKIDDYHNNSTNIGANVLFYIDTTVLNHFFYIISTCNDIGEQLQTIFLKEGEPLDLQSEHFNGPAYINCVPDAVSKCNCPGRLINTTGSPNVTWEWKTIGSNDILSNTNRLIVTPTESGDYYVIFDINGAKVAGPPIRVVLLKNNYDVPKRKLDAGYYQMSDGKYYFKFVEEYNVATSTPLQYKIYDNNYSPLTSPAQVEKMGDNRYAVNLIGTSAIVNEYYIVEIFNSKNEKWISRIRYKQ